MDYINDIKVMLKKEKVVILFFLLIILFPISANSFSELRTRLSFINRFCANFVQKITDSSGMVLQENNGELWIQRPSSFNYHIIAPEESYLISNGEILWFYDPSLDQVIVRWLKDVFNDSLFKLLLVDDRELDLYEYDIDQNGDTFFLIPKNNRNISVKKIEIQINNRGVIKEFAILNKENQYIRYQLTRCNMCSFDVDKFNFHLPNGVIIDDQR